jgi:hypothetical protein
MRVKCTDICFKVSNVRCTKRSERDYVTDEFQSVKIPTRISTNTDGGRMLKEFKKLVFRRKFWIILKERKQMLEDK